ncbi:MAG: hypothetical protein NTU98_10780 [Bacteroidetes bacterium]|nr:hypothetical protein [Bacteroidota bacterium]
MKKTFIILLALLVSFPCLKAQNAVTTETKPPAKKSQSNMPNEFYGGYGALSIFYFTGRMRHSSDYPTETTYYNGNYYHNTDYTDTKSPGTFYVGFGRSLNKVVSVGFMFGYQDIKYTETYKLNTYDTTEYKINADDQLLTGIARVTFTYLNKPTIRMYSGIGIGVTIDFGKASGDIDTKTERRLWPGGQLTLMGLRFGRAFGGFIEFGFGSYGIVNAGLSYKFAD